MANRRRPVVPPKSDESTSGSRSTGSSRSRTRGSGSTRSGASTTDSLEESPSTPSWLKKPASTDDGPGTRTSADESSDRAEEKAGKKAEDKSAASDKKGDKAGDKAGKKSGRRPWRSKGEPAEAASLATVTGAAAAESTPARTRSSSTSRPASAAQPAVTAGPRTRTAKLRLVHLDPWSVMKTAFLLSIALGIIMIVAVTIIWGVLGAAGVWDSINSSVQTTVGSDSAEPFNITDYVGAGRVIGFTMVASVIDVVVLTALATLGAFVYNLAATLLGGVEMTLAEDR